MFYIDLKTENQSRLREQIEDSIIKSRFLIELISGIKLIDE